MTLQPRIDAVAAMLSDEYQIGLRGDLAPFERLLDRVETNISRYKEYRGKHDGCE